MEIEIGSIVFTTIGALAVFLVGFIVKPLAYVGREKLLWLWINKYVINDEFWREARTLVKNHCNYRYNFNHETTSYESIAGKGAVCHISKRDDSGELIKHEVTSIQMQYYSDMADDVRERLNNAENIVNKKRNTYDMILRHFGNDKDDYIEKEINRMIALEDIKINERGPSLLDKIINRKYNYTDKNLLSIMNIHGEDPKQESSENPNNSKPAILDQ